VKVCLGQINPTVGDCQGNARRMIHVARRAAQEGASLVVFPEMAVLGYPPRDLVEKPSVVQANLRALDTIAESVRDVAVIAGFVARNPAREGKPLRNAAAFIRDGEVASTHHKTLLPTYDVFDEARYFEPASGVATVSVSGWRIGICICEDMWPHQGQWPYPIYREDPVQRLVEKRARLLVNISASPFTIDKRETRRRLLGEHSRRLGVPLVYVNQVGGNDELVFDGNSMVFDARGRLVAQGADFEEDTVYVDLDNMPEPIEDRASSGAESAHKALVLGTRDYVRKCGFSRALVGLSGGIDSAVTCCIGAAALGPENVLGVSMPSRFSSEGSKSDAAQLARNLGIEFRVIPIEQAHAALLDMLAPAFDGRAPDVTEENLQARVRGTVLMALANKFRTLLLATGNKSELAAGYCTLYGDMCGALAVIGDVPKTMVYALARFINRERAIIPLDTLSKAPSAELRPEQTDQDSLPPYDVLDLIVQAYIEDGMDCEDIVQLKGMRERAVPPQVVADAIRMIETSEYKRRQAPPALKVTSKAFGYGRRVPIAKRFPTQ